MIRHKCSPLWFATGLGALSEEGDYGRYIQLWRRNNLKHHTFFPQKRQLLQYFSQLCVDWARIIFKSMTTTANRLEPSASWQLLACLLIETETNTVKDVLVAPLSSNSPSFVKERPQFHFWGIFSWWSIHVDRSVSLQVKWHYKRSHCNHLYSGIPKKSPLVMAQGWSSPSPILLRSVCLCPEPELMIVGNLTWAIVILMELHGEAYCFAAVKRESEERCVGRCSEIEKGKLTPLRRCRVVISYSVKSRKELSNLALESMYFWM